jgi:hypothetical protein
MNLDLQKFTRRKKMKRVLLLGVICLFATFAVTQMASAQKKIEGPWGFMIAACEAGKGGAASTDIDSLSEASKGAVTEDEVAKGLTAALQGIRIGGLHWVEAMISPTGGDNIQDMINANKDSWGGGWVDLATGIEDHSAYFYTEVISSSARSGVTMKVGTDDSVKVWVNGEVVHVNAVDRGASDFIDEFTADLKQGNNPVLVKSSERGGGWSMFFGIDGDPGVNVIAVEPVGKLATSWGSVKATY